MNDEVQNISINADEMKWLRQKNKNTMTTLNLSKLED